MQIVEANEARIPSLGFGTYLLEGQSVVDMVSHALNVGYRHVDTAQVYGNESEVGRGIEASSVDREEVFLTTKVWVDYFAAGDLPASVDESLSKLRTDYVDLLLLHWPHPEVPLSETLGALNEVRAAGKTKHIGVSNFTTKLISEAVELSEAPLVTNQVEYHPFLDQTPVLETLRANGMSLTAYSPLARGKVLEADTITEIARDHGKTNSQVALRWLVQQDGVIAIPKASRAERVEENFDIFDFELSDEEMHRISGLATPEGRLISPSNLAPEWDIAS
jgi:2,5-diketo-D-gluconate reductase B